MKNWIIYFSLAFISGYGRENKAQAADKKSSSELTHPTIGRTIWKSSDFGLGKVPIGTDPSTIDSKLHDGTEKSAQTTKPGSRKPGIDGFKGYFSKVNSEDQQTVKQKADAIRLTTIKTISDILKTSKPQGARKFELTLRLAEMHLERHDYLRESEIDSYQTQWEKWQTNDQKQQLQSSEMKKNRTAASQGLMKEPTLNHSQSKQQLKTAINILRSLVTEFPNNPKTSTALYVLGQSLLLDQNDMAETYLVRLTKSFPSSDDYPEACLALGEFYFERNLMQKAEEFYKKTLAFREHKAFPYALYKYAWTLYNLAYTSDQDRQKLFEKSLASMKIVIKMTEKNGRNPRNINLREEAINDLVVIWADVGNVDDAPAYFKSINASDKFYDLIERLAGIYSDQGKKTESLTLYQRILRESPLRKRNFEVHKKLVVLAEDGVDLARVAETIKNLNEFVKVGSAWSKAQDSKDIPAMLKETETLTKFYGTKFHKISQKSNNMNYAKSAANLYETYMTFFPDSSSAYEIRYYYADLLYTLGIYDHATKQFLKVAQSKVSSQYRFDASMSAVASAEENLEKLGFNDQDMPPSLKRMELPPAKILWKDSVENFLTLYPSDKHSSSMMIALSSTLFRYGHKIEAIDWYEKLAKAFPSSKEGKQAMQFVVVYYLEQKNYDKAYEIAGIYRRFPEISSDGELTVFLSKRIREAAFGKGLLLEEKKKYLEAGDHFSAFQKLYPADEIADKAVYNAIANYLKAGAIKNMITASELLAKAYPNSKLRADVMANLAETEESLGDYEDARKAYLNFASNYPQDSRSRLALINAARLARGLGKTEIARAGYLAVIKSYPSDPLVIEWQLELAQMLEKNGTKEQAKEAWAALAEPSKSSRDFLEYALIAEAHLIKYSDKPKTAARELATKLRSTKVQALAARNIVGSILFQGLENDIDTFKNTKSIDSKNLEASISAKNEKLIHLTKQLVKIAEVAGPEAALRAQIIIGDLHKNFSDSLMGVELGAEENAENKEAIKNDLEKLAQPLTEQAYTFYQNAWQIAEEIPVFSEWTNIAFDRMGIVNPEKFKPITIDTIEPSYLGHRVRLNKDTKDLGI